jgi:hypothetical protein
MNEKGARIGSIILWLLGIAFIGFVLWLCGLTSL